MNWKFWKKSPSNKDKVYTIPVSSLYRWYCYDVSLPNLKQLDEAMGLVPVSEDAEEMERASSEKRVAKLDGLAPFLEVMAGINASVHVRLKEQSLDQAEGFSQLPEKIQEFALLQLEQSFSYMSVTALVAAFSAAEELGLITINQVTSAEVDNDADFSLGDS